MDSLEHYGEWGRKGATLSDKSARKEFGLTQKEVIEAINAGKLQYREGNIYGTPWFRLLRREVTAFVEQKHGATHLQKKELETELAKINKKLRALNAEAKDLQARKCELESGLKNYLN
jgi:hypothetical protein